MADDVWVAQVKGILRAEIKRRGFSHRQVAEKLGQMGIGETERNIINIIRGGFTAVFFVQCLTAIGCQTVRLADE